MPEEYFKKPGKQKSGGLNYGKSTGLFTRGGFPDHSDVKPGPLNSSPGKLLFDTPSNDKTSISTSGAGSNTKDKLSTIKLDKIKIEPIKTIKTEEPDLKPIEVTKKTIETKPPTSKEIISGNKQEYKDLKADQKEDRKIVTKQFREASGSERDKIKKDWKTLKGIQKDERKQLKKTHRDEKVDALNVDREASGEKKDPRHYKSDKKTRFGRWADKLHQWRSDEESSHGDFQKVIDNAQQFVQTMSGGKVKAPKSFEQKQMERKSFAEDLKRKQLLNEQRNIHLAKMKENTTNTFDPFAVNNSGDPNNETSSIVASNANEIDMNEEQKRMYNERGDQYKDYSEKEYMDESKRQQDIYDQTGRWDYKNAPK